MTIVAVKIDRGKVQIGVGAPASVVIFREELRERFNSPKAEK